MLSFYEYDNIIILIACQGKYAVFSADPEQCKSMSRMGQEKTGALMLSKNIKKLRKKQNLSQEKLAQKAGITYSTLIKMESGLNKNPTLETIIKLADVFKVTIDELVGRKK